MKAIHPHYNHNETDLIKEQYRLKPRKVSDSNKRSNQIMTYKLIFKEIYRINDSCK